MVNSSDATHNQTRNFTQVVKYSNWESDIFTQTEQMDIIYFVCYGRVFTSSSTSICIISVTIASLQFREQAFYEVGYFKTVYFGIRSSLENDREYTFPSSHSQFPFMPMIENSPQFLGSHSLESG